MKRALINLVEDQRIPVAAAAARSQNSLEAALVDESATKWIIVDYRTLKENYCMLNISPETYS